MNRLHDIFTFSEEFPLIFTQANFWIFFAVAYFIFALVYKKVPLRNSYLFFISLFFYYKTSGLFIGILIFSTIVDFIIGRTIYKSNNQTKRYVLVTMSVVINLLVLCYFKYAYFFTDSFNILFNTQYEVVNYLAQWGNSLSDQTYFTVDKIILPVGISFYTFQTISYSVDIFRRKLKPLDSILDFGFYVSFFPQLVAGPIVRASEFIPQLYKPYKLSKAVFGLALFWILNGLLKKLILADYIASNFADRVFLQPTLYSGLENALALVAYSLQVYADFSGYTDVAIGVAMLMGFTLTKNFNSPYKAISVSDFWRRWHISLSTWLRDYLYIPLGGNRQGSIASYIIVFLALFVVSMMADSYLVPISLAGTLLLLFALTRLFRVFRNWLNTNINVMLTMLLGGFWHGSSWNFVTWGGLNGLGLMVYKLWSKIRPWNPKSTWAGRLFGVLTTLVFITLTRAWFRAPGWDEAVGMLDRIWTTMDWSQAGAIFEGYKKPLGVMVVGYCIHWIPSIWKEKYRNAFASSPIILQFFGALLAVFVIYQSLAAESQPFIYFQF